MSGPRLLMVAGEASGDLHGGNLVRELLSLCPDVRVRGIGGCHMQRSGVEIVFDISKLSVVGFLEVARALGRIRKAFRRMCDELEGDRPDALVLVDYPGFNLRLAEVARSLGVPVIYYISPQVWAWGRRRIKRIKRTVDRMIVVFDFEADLYRRHGVDVVFVGHPLLDCLDETVPEEELRSSLGLGEAGPVVGLLPGSRDVEVKAILPAMLGAAERIARGLSGVQFVLPCAPTVGRGRIQRMVDASGVDVKVVAGRTHDVMRAADVVIVASGTATLEAAIWGVPMVVVYKLSFLTWAAARSLVRVDDIGLVNVVAGKRIVPELLQYDAKPSAIADEALSILRDEGRREAMAADLAEVRSRLGGPGASRRAAEAVLEFVGGACSGKGLGR